MFIIIKNLSLAFCATNSFCKTLNIALPKFKVIICSILLACISFWTEKHLAYNALPLIILLSSILHILIFKRTIELTVTVTIISYSISYITFTLSALIVSLFTSILSSFALLDHNRLVLQTIVLTLHIILTILLFKPKRFKKGLPFLSNRTINSTHMLLSLFLLFIFLIMNSATGQITFIIYCFVSFLFAIFIYIYWRNNITRTYNEKLRLRDIQDLNKLLDSKEDALKEIKADKDRLSAIVHTDNKLVPAMIQAVESFLTDFPNATPEMVARGEEILHTLDGYMESRKDDLAEQDKKCFIKMTSTGIPAVNLTLEHMYAKAQANDIALAVNIEADVDFLSQTTISEDELNTMISDLLENAIIATSYTGNKRILFTIGMLGNALSISVFDSGIPFTKEVLVDFGREKHTTHGDTGGSGIGLMTIYEIAHKHRATIAIEENDTEQSHYTKRIAITFNKRGNYILNTLRNKEEIAYLRQRTDLIINLKSSKM